MKTRLGIIGTGYGATVLLPAFRAEGRFEVVAIGGRNGARSAAVAAEQGIATAFDDIDLLLAAEGLEAIAVAVPPLEQERLVPAALKAGLHVFAEKPMSLTIEGARRMLGAALVAGVAHVVDFNFREIAAFGAARDLMRSGAVGAVRHVIVTWQVESYANRMRLRNWKADEGTGGGALFNFVSHALDYLEDLVGPIVGLSARLDGIPGDERPNDAFVALAFEIEGGVAGSLTMSAAAYKGSGHRIEIYGEDGTLVIENTTADYMRGFRVMHARRPGDFEEIAVTPHGPDPWSDGRILPVSRLARRFSDWIQSGIKAESNFEAGLRVQDLLEVARMAHRTGRWIACAPSDLGLLGPAKPQIQGHGDVR